jgi:hypothetical protein
MQKLFAKIAMVAMLGSMLFVAPVSTQAVTAPLWNVTGTYVFSFEYGSPYLHDVTLVQDALGNLTGSGGNPAGGPHVYTWVLTSGSVSGNAITFTADYTASPDAVTPQTTMIVTGTIAPNGTMSGTWSDNYQGNVRNGTWSTTGAAVSVNQNNVIVTPADLDNTSSNPGVVMLNGLNKWFMYNDTTDQIDNTLGSFVVGPSTPFFGTGSIAFILGATPLDRKNIATFQFSGTPLASITNMSFGTYSNSGVGISANENPYLAFNVDFNSTGSWQKRLVYVPSLNGTVTQDSWQNWDAIDGGAALWVYSGETWPGSVISGAIPRTWSSIINTYPGIRLLPVGGWLGVRVGEPGPTGYTGNVDYFKFGTNAGVTTFDFDPVPPNQNPIANAGLDQTITLPANSTALDGSGSSDSDGTITSYTWTQVSGPSVVEPDDVVGPTVTGLVEGTYVFQLVVTDNLGAISAPDTVSITVEHIPAPTNKDQCKNDGWKVFTNPSFKNQGQCVAYTNHLE